METTSNDKIDTADTTWPRQWAKVLEPQAQNKWGFGPWRKPISTFSGWKLNDFSEEISQTQKRLCYWLGKGESTDGFNEVRALWCTRYLDYLREHSDKADYYEQTYAMRDQSPIEIKIAGQYPRNRIAPMPSTPNLVNSTGGWPGALPVFITKRAREESLLGKAQELDSNVAEASPTVVFKEGYPESKPEEMPLPTVQSQRPFRPPRKKRRVGQAEMRWLAEVDLTCPSPMPEATDEEDDLLLQQDKENNLDSSDSEEE